MANEKHTAKVVKINPKNQEQVENPTQSNAPDAPISVAEIVDLIENGNAAALLDLAQKQKVYIIPEHVGGIYMQQKADLQVALQTASGIYNEIARLKDKIIPLVPLVEVFSEEKGKIDYVKLAANLDKINALMDLFKSFQLDQVFNQNVLNQFMELSKRYPDAFPVPAMQEIVDAFKQKLGGKK